MSKINEIKKILGMKSNENLKIVTITPEIADKLLMYNTHNRPRQLKRIKEYTADMKIGKWVLSESCIGFDSNGVLTNGQTRLEACINANAEFESIVCTCLEQNTHIDTGNVRKVVDNIILNGDADDYINVNASSLKVVCELLRLKNYNQRVTAEPVIEFCKQYGKFIDKAYDNGLLSMRGQTTGLFKAQIAAAFLVALMNGVDVTTLAHIRTVLTSGMCKSSNDEIIIRWRDKLLSFNGTSSNVIKKQIYLGTQDVINSVYTGKSKKKITTDTEWYPIL